MVFTGGASIGKPRKCACICPLAQRFALTPRLRRFNTVTKDKPDGGRTRDEDIGVDGPLLKDIAGVLNMRKKGA